MKKLAFLLVLITFGFITACKKEQPVYNKGITGFRVIFQDASGVMKEYPGVISGTDIAIDLPAEVDVTSLKATFQLDNPRTIVQVGSVVQESGITQQNFTDPVVYTVKAEDKSVQTYRVTTVKKVAIRAFGFYKEDNPSLAANYVGQIKGLSINVAVPESVDLTKLIARFETNNGAVLKVGTTVQESKKTVNDFSAPVTYVMTDASLTAALNYVVSISFLGPKWLMIGDENIIGPTATDIKLAFNPFTNLPYFTYQRTGKENNVDIPSEKRNVAVIRYTGTSWEHVGPASGVIDVRSESPNIAFDSNGDLYLGFIDYTGSDNKPSVMKYVNNVWVPYGTQRFAPAKTTKQTFILGENNTPIVGMVVSAAGGAYARNALYVGAFQNSAWTDITQLSKMIGSVYMLKGLDGKAYMAFSDRSPVRANFYKLENNVWQPIGPTPFTTTDNLPGYTSINAAVAKDGTPYVAYQTVVASQRNNRVLKYNGTAWVELGTAGSSQDQTDKYNLAIHPDGTVFFAYANTSGLYFRTFNKDTNNWNTARLIISGKINNFDMQIAPDGTPYLAASLSANNKTVVYKYTLSK